MPTNLLTNPDFSDGSTGWTTDSPLADGTRTYTFVAATAYRPAQLESEGTGIGSISQLLTVAPGDRLFLSYRGFCDSASYARWGIYIPASGEWRHISDAGHTAPVSQKFGAQPAWHGGEVTIPAGVTSVRVVLALPAGSSWITELNAFTSPNLVKDGDFSTNTTGATGGDGVAPEGWTLDWHQVSGSPGGWTTEGGTLKHTGTDQSGCACAAFAVTADEYLHVSADGWGSIANGARVRVAFGTTSNFTAAAAIATIDIAAGTDFTSVVQTWAAFVQVPATATYARMVVYNLASGTCYWDRVRARRISAMGRPSVRVEVSFGQASEALASGRDTWVVGAASAYNEVGSTFLASWAGSSPAVATWTDVTEWVRRLGFSVGRNSKTAEYETGMCSFTLDNKDRRFDPLYLSGPFVVDGRSYCGRGRPVRVSLEDPDTGEPFGIYTGRSTSWKPKFTPNGTNLVEVSAGEYLIDLNAPLPETTFASARSDVFLGDVLDALDWPTEWRRLDEGLVTVPSITVSGSMLGWMRKAAQTERGAFYLDGMGKVRFRVASTYRTANVMATFDPSDAANTHRLDYAGVQVEYDNNLTRNHVTGTRYGGTASDAQEAKDATAINEDGDVPYTVTDLLFGTNAEVLTWAEAVLAANTAPDADIRSIELEPEVNAMWWAFIMWAEFGDRYSVVVEPPPEGSAAITQTVQYEALTFESTNIADQGITARWGFVPAGL